MHPTPVGGALYTLDIGGNDIFKALDELHAGQISPSVAGTAIAQAEANTVHAVEALFAGLTKGDVVIAPKLDRLFRSHQ